MGTQICTHPQPLYPPLPPSSPSNPHSHLLTSPPEEELEEYDNPSRGISDFSFLKTEVIASNKKMAVQPASCRTLQRVHTEIETMGHIERTFTPSQPPSVFQIESSEASKGSQKWSEAVHWQEQYSQEVCQSSDEQNVRGKQSFSSVLQGMQHKLLQQRPPDGERTSTILRQLSGFILSQKNMFQPINITKDQFIKFRNEEIQAHYKFLQKIGEGSYGNVYKAIHKRSRSLRAIKILKRTVISHLEHQKIMNQIQILKRLDHPHIIKIYEVFQYNSSYYIVTEYCEGGSLSKLTKQQLISSKHVQAIMKQLLSALAYIHSLSIVHRDIKLDNILLAYRLSNQNCERVDIRLIDFGLSKEFQGKQIKDRERIGTYTYMAPEVIDGVYSPKCDMWSAGIVFYYLVTRHHPFKAKTKEETFERIKNEDLRLSGDKWKEVKKDAKELLIKLLEKNSRARISSDEALLNSWISKKSDKLKTHEGVSKAIRKLYDYHRGNNFVSMIESYISYMASTQKELEECSQMFSLLDQNNDGYLQKQELRAAFQASSQIFSSLEIEYVIKKMDPRSGRINYSQFVTMLSDRSKLFARQSLVEAFEYLDADGNGFLSKQQLREALRLSDCDELNCFLSELDSNQDEKISLQEFIAYLKSQNGCL